MVIKRSVDAVHGAGCVGCLTAVSARAWGEHERTRVHVPELCLCQGRTRRPLSAHPTDRDVPRVLVGVQGAEGVRVKAAPGSACFAQGGVTGCEGEVCSLDATCRRSKQLHRQNLFKRPGLDGNALRKANKPPLAPRPGPNIPVHARNVLFLDRERVVYVGGHWEVLPARVAAVQPSSNPRLPDALNPRRHYSIYSVPTNRPTRHEPAAVRP